MRFLGGSYLEPMSPVPPMTMTFVMLNRPYALLIGNELMLGGITEKQPRRPS
jgi:hypothetical protein